MERGDAVVHGAPVRHDQPFVAPLLAQNFGEQRVVLGAVGAVELVVGAHDRPRLCPLDDALEGGQVDLTQRALVDDGIDAEALRLLVVGREVLERGADTLALDAFDQRGGQFAGVIGVFGEVLEVAPAERRALHVDAGAEQHVGAQRNRLGRQRLAHGLQQFRIPGGRQQRGGGEAGGRQALRGHGMDVRHAAHAVRPVGDKKFRHAQSFHGRRRPRAGARAERGFFFEGHLLDNAVNVWHQVAHFLKMGGNSFAVIIAPGCGNDRMGADTSR